MSSLDWIVLGGTLLFIISYGVYKTKGSKSIEAYLLGNKQAKWWTVGISVMATQASAITFLSTPGQAYHDGMGFVQFYFGLPIAMVIICVTFIPIYHRLKVFTAYEYLEKRFDLKTRSLAAFLFLIQRGLGAGITIYAPSIILSRVLGWDLNITCIVIGIMVIAYTVTGGTRAVSITQKQQMAIIFLGMFITFFLLLDYIPDEYSFGEILTIAGANEKLDILSFEFDLNNRYNFWSGIIGGSFLALAYFGTDQSQVQRYLSGKSIRESRLGLIFNGFLKVPMQFFILLVGVMVFVFYQFYQAPIFFNTPVNEQIKQSGYAQDFTDLESEYQLNFENKIELNAALIDAIRNKDNEAETQARASIIIASNREKEIRNKTKEIITQYDPDIETNDKDYVFITFILNQLPKGIVGLLLAVIFSAAMSSTASELNALASTTTVDIYKRSFKSNGSAEHYLIASKAWTVFWGLVAILFATVGSLFENLIQFVNIIGSLFYGTILGIFLVAFYIKKIKSNSVFIAALIAESIVVIVFYFDLVGYLWLNLVGALSVVILSFIIQYAKGNAENIESSSS